MCLCLRPDQLHESTKSHEKELFLRLCNLKASDPFHQIAGIPLTPVTNVDIGAVVQEYRLRT
ncbi:unnamed protein product [Darwinula stevensoni]|uniref:Uncharacterized protein n=1 Tax=Darwinula stevensoni TaxID=69355 RepID=A0A7R9FNF9_9CRUS|nr:unnamed protein product [Darwinula stevensoni]CAG0896639.1 unnamed protein product [Darwinula stevensoni]